MTGEGEPKFFNAVTGKDISFLDGIETGKRIWNLDNAIWTLQGRHRDMVHFAEFIYQQPFVGRCRQLSTISPGLKTENGLIKKLTAGIWTEKSLRNSRPAFISCRAGDETSGWPKRSTLEALDLAFVADELEAKGKLGAE